jgi:hypothetical protein
VPPAHNRQQHGKSGRGNNRRGGGGFVGILFSNRAAAIAISDDTRKFLISGEIGHKKSYRLVRTPARCGDADNASHLQLRASAL